MKVIKTLHNLSARIYLFGRKSHNNKELCILIFKKYVLLSQVKDLRVDKSMTELTNREGSARQSTITPHFVRS